MSPSPEKLESLVPFRRKRIRTPGASELPDEIESVPSTTRFSLSTVTASIQSQRSLSIRRIPSLAKVVSNAPLGSKR